MSKEITVVRIYILEGHDQMNQTLDILHDEEGIHGTTVIRGIAGFGESKEIHTSSLLNLSLELPLIVEFYDETEKALQAIEKLKHKLPLKHIISWTATAHIH